MSKPYQYPQAPQDPLIGSPLGIHENIMPPGVPVEISPDQFLLNPQQTHEQYGLGFSASLRAVVHCGGETPDTSPNKTFYIFDRGDDIGYQAVAADLPSGKTTVVIAAPTERYVIVSQKGLDAIRSARDTDSSIKHNCGWKSFAAGEEFTLGRNDESDHSFGPDIPKSVSRSHVKVSFGTEGNIVVTDQNAFNGTWMNPVGRPKVAAPQAERDAQDETRPPRGRHARVLGESALSFVERPNSTAVGSAEQAVHGEDTLLNRPDLGLFGAFDGAGGHKNGKLASQLASDVVNQYLGLALIPDSFDRKSLKPRDAQKLLHDALDCANVDVNAQAGGGLTTAVVTLLHQKGRKQYASWAAAGDSPAFLYNRFNHTLQRLTVDEMDDPARPWEINNAVGTGKSFAVKQFGTVELQRGDEIIMCTDGITGDKPEEVLSPQEIANVMWTARSAQEAAHGLLAISRKPDDKAVLVIKPNLEQ